MRVNIGLGIHPPLVGILPSGLVASRGTILGVNQRENIRRSARTSRPLADARYPHRLIVLGIPHNVCACRRRSRTDE
jgi:hypothetical protein